MVPLFRSPWLMSLWCSAPWTSASSCGKVYAMPWQLAPSAGPRCGSRLRRSCTRCAGPPTATSALAVALIRHGADWLKLWVDKRFFREAYSAEKILGELSDKVRTIVETRALLETVTSQVADSLHLGRIAVILLKGSQYTVSYAVGFNEQPDSDLCRRRRGGSPCPHDGAARAHLPGRRELLAAARRCERTRARRAGVLETQLLVPLAFQNRLPIFLSITKGYALEIPGRRDRKSREWPVDSTGRHDRRSWLCDQRI